MQLTRTDDPQLRWLGAAASVLVHVALIALLLTQLRQPPRGSPAASAAKAIQITMAPPAVARPKVVQPPAPPVPPKPVDPPKEEPKVSNVPIPVPPKPQPPKKAAPAPAPTTPAPPSPVPKPPGPATQKAAPAPPAPLVETPEQSLIGRIHDNWLEPAAVPRSYRCQVRISYLAGGRIADVQFLRGCGEGDLLDSVRRAIYKTQPLPLLQAKTAPGSIDIEFTP